jgi:NodT family efflux transporter outer membrane factor (OMF) lipoprotein
MSTMSKILSFAPAGAALLLAGCVNLAPDWQRPTPPVPPQLPVPVPAGARAAENTPPQSDWNTLLRDARLRQVVALALQNNRDLRTALLAVEKGRAQLRLADADRWPTLGLGLSASRAPNTQGVETNTWLAGVQLSSYEVDLLGRLRNASDAAAASLLASEAGSRATRLAIAAQAASAWLALAADGEQLALARATLSTRAETLRLTALRARVGAASDIDLRGTQSLEAAARASVAQWERQVAQDTTALALAVGHEVPAEWLPGAQLPADALAPVPAGLSSDVLLARPDVVQAEQQLVAANANIGAARAALFPRLTLSGNGGQVSNTLAGLLDHGSLAYTLTASLVQTIFDAGRSQANVRVAEVSRDQALASYEKAVQSAFRETADALQAQVTWGEQVRAQREQWEAEQARNRLTHLKYEAGAASLLDLLDAERSLASAQQALVQVRLAETLNRLALYKALGGAESQPGSAGG